MGADPAVIRRRLRDFDFKSLFLDELGWDRFSGRHEIPLGERAYALEGIAEKRGFQVFQCLADGTGEVPERAIRMKLDRELAKLAYEHLIVFVDRERSSQAWHWGRREPGKPLAAREDSYAVGQSGQRLAERLAQLAVDIEEEEQVTLPTVAGRVRAAFDVDRVTKRFYDRFKTEHSKFLEFIDGIRDQGDREWYASLMLNRLMFVYFIQKRGFLDGDVNYLRNRMRMIQAQQGPDRFLSFYRQFLLRLFHEGLGAQPQMRAPDFETLLSRIPYVNGGLFEFHQLERDNPDINIADAAFERLFDFFDAYQWHLDERPLRADNEINPDVLGYIFEKYINQKQMGAYYTKEDITGYISRNTVLPFILDAARKDCAIAFRPDGEVWALLAQDPDRYIYEPVRRGIDLPLPQEIEAGINSLSRRGDWNRPAAPEFALPTETWREHVARRTRCLELREKSARGELTSVNDLISLNLDIEQFTQDAIDNIEGPDLLRAFWKALQNVTILDPTCGSGAFLFAALNLLEPLYEACLQRMATFVDELDGSGERHRPERFSDFRKILVEGARHPNRRHFVLKSIILNNLYGVDIMEEAVEICKLRLFLKLVAQVDHVDQVEPLPDIDFNIRAGNTLVGFATYEEVRKAVLGDKQSKMDLDGVMQRIDEEAEIADRAFRKFREMQSEYGMDATDFADAKRDLRERLRGLGAELDGYLAAEYGVDPRDQDAAAEWHQGHQPFHWFVEFYGIMKRGGFDAVIGNPPYVEYKDVRKDYEILADAYATWECGNLYAFCYERGVALLRQGGRVGLIVPVSSICTDGYDSLRTLLVSRGRCVVSSYNDRPSRLFEGLEHSRLAIILLHKSQSSAPPATTSYLKWSSTEREVLFQRLAYQATVPNIEYAALPKVGRVLEAGILTKLLAESRRLEYFLVGSGVKLFYTRKLSHFVQVLDFVPDIRDGAGKRRPPSELKRLDFKDESSARAFLCLLNSSLFYWWVTTMSDCRNLNRREVVKMPFDLNRAESQVRSQLGALAVDLSDDLKRNSVLLPMRYQSIGTLTIQCIYPRKSKPIIDRIDEVLALHFSFSDQELDFLQNFDVKYRMGAEVGDEDSD